MFLPLPAPRVWKVRILLPMKVNSIVSRGGKEVTRLYSQKRRYLGNNQVMTEAAIDAGLTRDLYVSLGEPLDGGQAWAVRIYHKPFVRFIWLGALFMTAAGITGSR